MSIFIIIFLLLFFAVFIVILGKFLFSIFDVIAMLSSGAFYAKSRPEIMEKMLALLDIKKGDKAVDLGSGDGRLVIALALAGAEAHGYEINPFLVWLSRRNIKNAGLNGKAFVHHKNFWNEDFSKFNLVTIYGVTYIMENLELKLKKELKKKSKVISNYFEFPNWPYAKMEIIQPPKQNVYLYIQQ